MISRRNVVLGGVAAALAPLQVAAHDENFKLDPRFEPQTVRFTGFGPGVLVVDP